MYRFQLFEQNEEEEMSKSGQVCIEYHFLKLKNIME